MATKTYNGVTLEVTKRQGWTLDTRTAEYFDAVNSGMPGGVVIIQGSYNTSVGASAGTHDGPGALDLKPADPNKRNTAGYKQLETVARQRGGAAWFRPWANNYHVHIIVIGTRGLPAIAAKQVVSYLNGRDGLVSNLRITGVINTTFEKWKNAVLNIGAAVSDNAKVRLMQKAVRQTVDGVWGEQTDIDLRNTRAEALAGYKGKYFNMWNDVQQKRMQKSWGAYQDGLWGPATAALAKKAVIDIQRALGQTADGIWGPVTDRAFVALRQKIYKGTSGLPSVPVATAPKPAAPKPIDFSYPFARGHANFFPYPGKQGASYYGPSVAGRAWYSGKTAGGTNGESTWDTGNLNLAAIRSRIKKIQKFLGITQDGMYGAQTVAAVKRYQAKKKFNQDGIVGPGTWQAMARDRGQ